MSFIKELKTALLDFHKEEDLIETLSAFERIIIVFTRLHIPFNANRSKKDAHILLGGTYIHFDKNGEFVNIKWKYGNVNYSIDDEALTKVKST